jgi:hypothetical protein
MSVIHVPIGNNLINVGTLNFDNNNHWVDLNVYDSSNFDPIERGYSYLKINTGLKHHGVIRYNESITNTGWYKIITTIKLETSTVCSGITFILGSGYTTEYLTDSYSTLNIDINAIDISQIYYKRLIIDLLGEYNQCLNKKVLFNSLILYATEDIDDVSYFDNNYISQYIINLMWGLYNNNNVIIAYSHNGVFGTPHGLYNINDNITGGGVVVYKGNDSNVTLSITPGDKLYYKIWTYKNGSDSITYYTQGIQLDVISPPINFNGQSLSSTIIYLSWDLNNNNDNIILAYSTSSFNGDINSGTTYPIGSLTPGNGTVLYSGSSENIQHYGLLSNTHYYYRIWSYENSTTKYSKSINELNILTINGINDPSNFDYTILNSNQIKLTWNLNLDNDNILLASGNTENFDVPNTNYNIGDNIGDGVVLLSNTGLTEYIDNVNLIPPYSIFYKIWSQHVHDYSAGILINISASQPVNGGGFYGGVFYNGYFYGKWYNGRWIKGDFVEPPAEWHSINPKPN